MTRSHRMPHRAGAVLLSVTTVAVTGASAVAFGAAGTTIYTSPTGNDANPGSQSQPVRSLSHARDLARVADHGGDITIQLAQGLYRSVGAGPVPAVGAVGPRSAGFRRRWAPGGVDGCERRASGGQRRTAGDLWSSKTLTGPAKWGSTRLVRTP